MNIEQNIHFSYNVDKIINNKDLIIYMLCPILLFQHITPYGDLVSPSLVLSLLLSLYSDYLPPPCTLHLWPCGAMSLEPVILTLYTHMAAAGNIYMQQVQQTILSKF